MRLHIRLSAAQPETSLCRSVRKGTTIGGQFGAFAIHPADVTCKRCAKDFAKREAAGAPHG